MPRTAPALLLAVALGLTACSGTPEATRDDAGAIATEGSVDAFALEIGDCILEPEGTSSEEGAVVDSVKAVPCDQPHDGEVYAEGDLQDGDYPGDTAVEEQSLDLCGPRFGEYVGKAYEESALDFFPITPTKDSWEQQDDRTVSCVLFDPEAQVSGSLKGSAR